ncbi:MAG: tRNA dihydrouridine synthase DusB [Candidatus Kapabacteria bacterium]|nr:tRNA dihydrouridine synthase DusB [Candidatus Kapabacteria bacterium]MDW8012274.1 tRNA dihydrouridine synthase DusB [Bacteroidota bacterium]
MQRRQAVLRIGSLELHNAVLLAPMEDVTDSAFRLLCRQMGADIVYTEFVSSDALVRNAWKAYQKIQLHPEEHPVAIQIFGGDIPTVVEAACRAVAANPDFLDLNCGCWVQNVVARNAGAALLKDPDRMVAMAAAMVRAVPLPVTVKTRLGWSRDSINIVTISQRLEQEAGIASLCVHCRTRDQGHSGQADWSWIPRIKAVVSIPVILNGDVKTPEDVLRAFRETGCDAVMIGRAAIGNPFIFRQAKEFLATGTYSQPTPVERIHVCLQHLRTAIASKGEERAIRDFRIFYAGYLRGLPHSAAVRNELMRLTTYAAVEDTLLTYAERLAERDILVIAPDTAEESCLSCVS